MRFLLLSGECIAILVRDAEYPILLTGALLVRFCLGPFFYASVGPIRGIRLAMRLMLATQSGAWWGITAASTGGGVIFLDGEAAIKYHYRPLSIRLLKGNS